jgi:acyl dehydratase
MAIRGEYSDEEKKWLTEARKLIGKTEYAKEESHVGYVGGILNRVASRDLIRRYTQVIGDDNPLWVNDEYARKTKHGCIIAPPFFLHCIAIGAGGGRELLAPPSVGRLTWLNVGGSWQFFKPVCVDDSFKVKDVIFNSIEDKTRLDGKGPRQFLSSSDRTYINQREEVVCVVNRRMMNIIVGPPTENPAKDWKEFPIPQAFPEYEYTEEEQIAIDRTFEEEERCGANPRYWEDITVGEELRPVIRLHNMNDQVLAYALQGFYVSNRVIRKECAGNPDLKAIAEDFMYQSIMGILMTTFGTQMDAMLGHLITNWMGDDGFLKSFDTQFRIINPRDDANWCKGKVIKKYVQNGERLVDIAVWIESIRGWIVTPATATVVLPSRTSERTQYPEMENSKMAEFQVGDRVRVKDRPEWPGRYKLTGAEGSITRLQEPAGYVMVRVERTEASVIPGTTLVFRSDAVEKI